MDLAIDARMLSCSGIGTVIKNLLQPLSSPPFKTTLISSVKSSSQPVRLNQAPIYSLQEQFSLPLSIPSCDLFWSPHYNIPLLPIRAKKRIVTIHDAYHLAHAHLLTAKEKLYAKIMFAQAVSRSDAVITDSEFSKSELCRFLSVPPEKIRVIYPGVDFKKFSKKKPVEEWKAVQRKYQLPSSFFLFVGNVKPHKNLRLLLQTYREKDVELPLVIVGKIDGLRGKDSSIDAIHHDTKLQGKVFLTGEVLDEEIPFFYQSAQGLLFPSLYEGFGLPPLEAMAAGCPVAVLSRASLPEVCGNSAYFFKDDCPDSVAEAMRDIVRDAPEWKEKGREQVMRFSWEKTAFSYREVFQEIYFR